MMGPLRLAALGGGAPKQYVDDVFSAYPYTGTGAAQSISNGIDLVGKGGLTWIKNRDATVAHFMADTVQGMTFSGVYSLDSSLANARVGPSTNIMRADSAGFSLGSSATGTSLNGSGTKYASWAFRMAPKFFDIQLFTAGSSTNRRISHGLGIAPGMVLIKCITGASQGWYVYHQALGRGYWVTFNGNGAFNPNADTWGTSDPTSTDFGINETALGLSGDYVAYFFANDTAPDGIIQCGTFTTDVDGNASVSLGWEPQYTICKRVGGIGAWTINDVSRGMPITGYGASAKTLIANGPPVGESVGGLCAPTAQGFVTITNALPASAAYVYIAIRRSNKPPTSGTQVYNAATHAGTAGTLKVTGVGFSPDLVFSKATTGPVGFNVCDRLRAPTNVLPISTASEFAQADALVTFDPDGVTLGADNTVGTWNTSGYNYVNHFFKRAPGFFDEVFYTGTDAAHTEAHNLGVVPELMILKDRPDVANWAVYTAATGASNVLFLNATSAVQGVGANYWNSTAPTASVFSVGTNWSVGFTSYVMYLFASLSGVSKVFNYTGNGTSQTINCGFSAGARFIMIKRTDTTGDWFVWDTVRGIVSGNDPHLSLNTTAVQVTTDDSIDPDSSGFIVNQLSATNINVTSATYIGLAVA